MLRILFLCLLLISCGGDDYGQNYDDEVKEMEADMALSVFDKTVVDTGSGAAVPNSTVTVNLSGGGLADLYSDSSGTTPISNPTTADADGRVTFYVNPGKYTIQATTTMGTVTYNNVIVNPLPSWEVSEIGTAQSFTLASSDDGTHFVLTGSGTYNITFDTLVSTPWVSGKSKVRFTISNPNNDTQVKFFTTGADYFDGINYNINTHGDWVEFQNKDGNNWRGFGRGFSDLYGFTDGGNVGYDDSSKEYYIEDSTGERALLVPSDASGSRLEIYDRNYGFTSQPTLSSDRLFFTFGIAAIPDPELTAAQRSYLIVDTSGKTIVAGAVGRSISNRVETRSDSVDITGEVGSTVFDLDGNLIADENTTFTIPKGQLWQFDSQGNVWRAYRVDGSGGGGATSLNDLIDVDVPSPANGEVLAYNSGTNDWEAQAVSGLSPPAIAGYSPSYVYRNQAVDEKKKLLSATAFPFSGNITIGETGSSATQIWNDLDGLPDNTIGLDLKISGYIEADATSVTAGEWFTFTREINDNYSSGPDSEIFFNFGAVKDAGTNIYRVQVSDVLFVTTYLDGGFLTINLQSLNQFANPNVTPSSSQFIQLEIVNVYTTL